MKMKRVGFTLIELSVVLIIIGLIIGAVMKGKDLISSAKQKSVYNTWVQPWVVAVNAYEDRTGNVLGDAKANGGTKASEDGKFDNVNLSTTTAVQNRLKAIGLEAPAVGLKNGGAYIIKGKYTTSTATAFLYNLYSKKDRSYKNRLYIKGVPTDVAIAFDKLTDGKVDATAGSFRQYQDNKAWPDASKTKTVNVSLEF